MTDNNNHPGPPSKNVGTITTEGKKGPGVPSTKGSTPIDSLHGWDPVELYDQMQRALDDLYAECTELGRAADYWHARYLGAPHETARNHARAYIRKALHNKTS